MSSEQVGPKVAALLIKTPPTPPSHTRYPPPQAKHQQEPSRAAEVGNFTLLLQHLEDLLTKLGNTSNHDSSQDICLIPKEPKNQCVPYLLSLSAPCGAEKRQGPSALLSGLLHDLTSSEIRLQIIHVFFSRQTETAGSASNHHQSQMSPFPSLPPLSSPPPGSLLGSDPRSGPVCFPLSSDTRTCDQHVPAADFRWKK